MLSVKKLYDDYRKQWLTDHSSFEFAGMEPADYAEWLDNEFSEFLQVTNMPFILTHFNDAKSREGGAKYLLDSLDEAKNLISEIANNPVNEWGWRLNGFDLSFRNSDGEWLEWRDELGRDMTDILNEDDYTIKNHADMGR